MTFLRDLFLIISLLHNGPRKVTYLHNPFTDTIIIAKLDLDPFSPHHFTIEENKHDPRGFWFVDKTTNY